MPRNRPRPRVATSTEGRRLEEAIERLESDALQLEVIEASITGLTTIEHKLGVLPLFVAVQTQSATAAWLESFTELTVTVNAGGATDIDIGLWYRS